MRFLRAFCTAEKLDLTQYLCDTTLLDRERKRFTAVFLNSEQRVNLGELSSLLKVSKNTLTKWFDSYEKEGFPGLLDGEMARNKSTLSFVEEAIILSSVEASPQNLKGAVAILEREHQIPTNQAILRRYLKKKSSLGDASNGL